MNKPDVIAVAESTLECHVVRLLILAAQHDLYGELIWDTNLKFSVICNDAFWWATADAEPITPDSVDALDAALTDGGDDGALLYCARQRRMRPQGAMYAYIDEANWALFDACGPEREVKDGNTPRPKARNEVM